MAKSIDELYGEVRDYDLVITNDAPLATALNARVDTARIGGFAYTPRQIATAESISQIGSGIWGNLRVISEISNETGYDFKFVHGELENIQMIRKYTENIEKYLYSKSSRNVYRSLSSIPTIERVMGSFNPDESLFFSGKKTAIIGIDLFDDLDKHFIPTDYQEIDIFSSKEFKIDKIYEMGNDRQLAENAVDIIDPARVMDTAIIMDTSGPIADAVRSALYRKKLPFKNVMTVKDLSQIRDFIQFLSLSLTYDTIRVRHVRELFSAYGRRLDVKKDEYLLNKVANTLRNREKELTDIMENIRNFTFLEVCEKIVNKKQLPQIKILLDDMKMADSLISSKLVNEITYAVNNVGDLHHNEEIPEDEKKGILLVDCCNSVYVDRPFVIYLGLGSEWSTNLLGKEYIDKEQEIDIQMHKFMILLQQGTSRIYIVNSMRKGKESRPCSLFDHINHEENGKEDISEFKNVCNTIIKGPWVHTEVIMPTEKGEDVIDAMPAYDWKFSKSSYNRYCSCPRAFMFNEIVPFIESDKTILGNIIHEFTEFYICYPDIVKEYGLGYYSNIIEERYSGLSCYQMKELDNSTIRLCMKNMIHFIDSLNICEVPLDMDYSKRKRPNMFMEIHGSKKYSSITETDFKSSINPIHGSFDLLYKNYILDYKTGKAHKASEIAELMSLEKSKDYVEFQPLIYLSLLKDNGASGDCTFRLFYAKDNEIRSIENKDFNIKDNTRDVILIESTFEELFSSEDSVMKNLFSKPIQNKWKGFVNGCLAYTFDKILEWNKETFTWNTFFDRMDMNDTASNRSTLTGALNKMKIHIKKGMIVDENTVIIPSDTMENFLSNVRTAHKKASLEILTRFPPEPLGTCERCNYYSICTDSKLKIEEEEDE